MKHPVRGVLLLVSVALLVTGCWDSAPIDQLAIVLTMGIDLGDEPDTFVATFEIVNAGAIGGGGGGGGGGGSGVPHDAFLITGQGRTLMEAVQSAQRRISRRLLLTQLRNIVFGETIVRQGISPMLDYLQRSGEFRRTISVLVAQGTAEELFQAEPKPLPVRGLTLDGLGFQANKTGNFEVIFGDFLERLVSPGAEAALPMVQPTPEGAQFLLSGLAVFRDDRMVGIFDDREALGLSLALGRARPQTVLIGEGIHDGNKFFASFSLQSVTSTIKAEVVDGGVEATISVRIQSFVFEQTGGPNLATPKGYGELEEMQKETVRRVIQATVDRAQEWEADVFAIGEIVERRSPQAWRQVEDDWPAVFGKIKLNVEVHSRVTETGLIRAPTPIPSRSSEP